MSSSNRIPRSWLEMPSDDLTQLAKDNGDNIVIVSALNVGIYKLSGVTFFAHLEQVSA